MGIFSGMNKAKIDDRGQFIRPGKYIAKIVALRSGQAGAHKGGYPYVVLKLQIVQNTPNDDGSEVNEVGAYVDYMYTCKLGQESMFQSSIKTLLMVLLQVPRAEVDSFDFEAEGPTVICEDTPLKDFAVDIEAFEKPTKRGGVFTILNVHNLLDTKQLERLLTREQFERYFPEEVLEKIREFEEDDEIPS